MRCAASLAEGSLRRTWAQASWMRKKPCALSRRSRWATPAGQPAAGVSGERWDRPARRVGCFGRQAIPQRTLGEFELDEWPLRRRSVGRLSTVLVMLTAHEMGVRRPALQRRCLHRHSERSARARSGLQRCRNAIAFHAELHPSKSTTLPTHKSPNWPPPAYQRGSAGLRRTFGAGGAAVAGRERW